MKFNDKGWNVGQIALFAVFGQWAFDWIILGHPGVGEFAVFAHSAAQLLALSVTYKTVTDWSEKIVGLVKRNKYLSQRDDTLSHIEKYSSVEEINAMIIRHGGVIGKLPNN